MDVKTTTRIGATVLKNNIIYIFTSRSAKFQIHTAKGTAQSFPQLLRTHAHSHTRINSRLRHYKKKRPSLSTKNMRTFQDPPEAGLLLNIQYEDSTITKIKKTDQPQIIEQRNKDMSENVELQQLVDEDSVDEPKIHDSRWNYCKCPYLGLLLATLSSLFFSLCSVIVKFTTDVDPMALAAYRYVGVLLPAIPIVIYRQEPILPKGKRIMLFLRSFTGTAALMLSFYAFRHMPLADASVIVFSVPVFTSIFAKMFLNEACGFFNAFSVVLTLIGVVFITRPTALFGSTIVSLGGSDERTNPWVAVAAFSATLFGANAYVLLRALKSIHFSVIMTNFGSFALVQCLLVSYVIGALCLPVCGQDRYLIVALAIFSFLGQILLTLALKLEQAGPVAIARSSDIVFAFIWQVLFFNEIPNKFSIGGAILVMSSVLLTGLRKWILALPPEAGLRRHLSILTK